METITGTRFISIPNHEELGLPPTIAIEGYPFERKSNIPTMTFQPTGRFSPLVPKEDTANRIPIYSRAEYSNAATDPESLDYHLSMHFVIGRGTIILRLSSDEFASLRPSLNKQLERLDNDALRLIGTDQVFHPSGESLIRINFERLCFENVTPIYCTTEQTQSRKAA